MNIKVFRAALNRVLLLPIEEEKDTPAGIVIPETAQQPTLFRPAVVISEGTGKQTEGGFFPPVYKRYDVVLYYRASGVEIEVNGKKCRLLPENEILGWIEGDLYGGLSTVKHIDIRKMADEVQPENAEEEIAARNGHEVLLEAASRMDEIK